MTNLGKLFIISSAVSHNAAANVYFYVPDSV